MSRTSGSQLDRVMACAASAALPGAFDAAGWMAVRGTDIHRFIHSTRSRGREVALFEAPLKLRDFCAAIDVGALDEFISPMAVGEPAFVFNALAGATAFLGCDIDRKYPAMQPGDFPYSSDYVDDGDDGVIVLDIKTGRLPVPHPRDNWQFRLGGVGCARWAGQDEARLVKAHLDENAEWHFESYDATALDLDAWAEELHGQALRIEAAGAAVAAGRQPDVWPSEDACRYCPCVAACPDKQALVRLLPTELRALSEATADNALTLEQLGAAWPVIQKMKALVEHIEAGLKDVARETPLPLPNGRRLIIVPEQREYIVDAVALKVLAEQFGEEAVARAVKQTVSKTSLKAGLGRDDAEHAVEAIRAAGGIDVRTTWQPREEQGVHEARVLGDGK